MTIADGGSYHVKVSNSIEAIASRDAAVVVDEPISINFQPVGAEILAGESATMFALASGSGPKTFQWQKDGVAVDGETSNTLVIENATKADEGFYTVIIGNTVGFQVSDEALLLVNAPPTIELIDPVIISTGDTFEVQVVADDEGDLTKLRYGLQNGPESMTISKSGLIQWTVGSGLEGNSYKIRILVVDQDGLAAGRNFSVTVNNSPQWEELGTQSGKEQYLLEFKPVVADANDTDLVVTAGGLPTGSTYDSESGFSWTPSSSQVGEYEVRFTASDPYGAKSELAVSVNVLANVGPTLAALGQVDILAGESASVQLEAADGDDDKSALAYSLKNAPDGMQVSETGLVSWVTQTGVHSGVYTAEAIVSDPLSASASQQLKVVVNGAPVVESVESLTLKVGEKVAFTVAASDPEGGNLTFKALNNPDGFKGSSRNGFRGKFSWTTKSAAAGAYKLDIEVTDAAGLKTALSVQVALNSNLAPTVEALAPVAVNAGGSVQVQVVANDVDDDNSTLRYVLENAPKGMEVSGDGLIQWSVDNQAETAVHSVTVIVLDGENAMGKQVLEVSVTANVPPTLAALDPVDVKTGGSLELQVVADDPDGDNATLKYLLKDAPVGMQISGSGLIQWAVPEDAEVKTHSVTVFTVDDRDALASAVLEVTIEQATAITLVSSPAVVGPFVTEAEAVIDEAESTITVAKGGGMRFYKLQSGDDTKLKITSIVIQGENVVMNYSLAGE
jgi:plastocyanin